MPPHPATSPPWLTPDLLSEVRSDFAVLEGLPDALFDRLLARALKLIDGKDFYGAAGLELDEGHHLAISLLGALPILELGEDWYDGFSSLVIYPGEFVTEIEEMDEDGLMHTGRDIRAGESWQGGPVVLALSDVFDSGQGSGFNVVIHELAHQLDGLNGDTDGFPPLHRDMDPARWTEVFTRAYEELNRQLDAGQQPTFDPYGAESPAEFFAVACELYFDLPGWMAEVHPELFAQLHAFFRWHPPLEIR